MPGVVKSLQGLGHPQLPEPSQKSPQHRQPLVSQLQPVAGASTRVPHWLPEPPPRQPSKTRASKKKLSKKPLYEYTPLVRQPCTGLCKMPSLRTVQDLVRTHQQARHMWRCAATLLLPGGIPGLPGELQGCVYFSPPLPRCCLQRHTSQTVCPHRPRCVGTASVQRCETCCVWLQYKL